MMADTAHTAWYVGSQNDGLFIIDQPPRPSTDDITTGPAGLNVIAKIYGGPNADRHARLIAASPSMYSFIKKLADEGDSDAAALIASI